MAEQHNEAEDTKVETSGLEPHERLIEPVAAVGDLFWGIDLGGTGIKVGLVDSAGETLAYGKIPTNQDAGPADAVTRMGELCRGLLQTLNGKSGGPLVADRIRRVGLGSPGPMDLAAGTLVSPPQLPDWWGFHLRDAVASELRLPVTFLNDANAAAYGEFWRGSGREDNSMIMLTLGTGVGGGIIVEDMLINGENSCGSECGHMIVDPSPDARLCIWGGGRGHLEAYASASAVALRAAARLKEGAVSALENVATPTALDVYNAASSGDPLALEIVDETAHWLGVGVTSLVHAIDPASVVLGGAMNFGGDGDPVGERFRQGVWDEFESRTFPALAAGTTIKFATLGGDAGYIGVAGYAKKESQ